MFTLIIVGIAGLVVGSIAGVLLMGMLVSGSQSDTPVEYPEWLPDPKEARR